MPDRQLAIEASVFDPRDTASYNRMSQEDSSGQTAQGESVPRDFRRRLRRFLSHVTYYQQTGGLHELVATAPFLGEYSPMPAANESQGLKIAVAAFITLSVILTVTSYFLYSAYSQAEMRAAAANDESNKAKAAQSEILKQFHTMRQTVGTRAEEFDAAKDEIDKHLTGKNTKVEERFTNLANTVNTAIQKAKGAGANAQELQDAQDTVQRVVASFRGEPNKTYISSLDRALELMESLSLLTTELSVNYENLKRSLEGATGVAKSEVDVQSKAAADSRSDLEGEHKKHEEERQLLLTKTDQLQTDNDKKANEIATLASRIKQMDEDGLRKQETLNTIIRELRDRLDQKETTLDRPDGYVTYVDYERREVLVNITRRQGRVRR